jgi:hypothetical protein
MELTTPFRCTRCDRTFTQREGGICSSCGRLFCSLHLNVIKATPMNKPICVECSQGHEKDPGFVKLVTE